MSQPVVQLGLLHKNIGVILTLHNCCATRQSSPFTIRVIMQQAMFRKMIDRELGPLKQTTFGKKSLSLSASTYSGKKTVDSGATRTWCVNMTSVGKCRRKKSWEENTDFGMPDSGFHTVYPN
jgi:hypothetical protein